MKIVLIHPPQPDSIDDKLNPSLSLLYLAAYAKKNGFSDIHYCELSGLKTKKEFIKKIPTADVYGITFYTCSYKIVETIAAICKHKNPICTVCVGGAHPSALPRETFRMPNIDSVFQGEAEKSFTQWLKDGCPTGIHKSDPLTKDEMNELPNPARELVKDYGHYTRTIEGNRCYDIWTSRGCPWECNFCYKAVTGKGVRFHNIDYVKRELTDLVNNGAKTFMFLDEVFTLKRQKRLYPLLDFMKDLNITFRNTCKPSYDKPEDFKRLKEAGCDCIGTGTETGSNKILNLMNKGCTVKDNYETIQMIKDSGIIARCYFMFGFPGETEETMTETLEFIEKADPDQISTFTFTPFPGNEVWINPEKFGITWMSDDWRDYQMIQGTEGIGRMPFETKWLKRDEAFRLNRIFSKELWKRKQRGIVQTWTDKLKIGEDNG